MRIIKTLTIVILLSVVAIKSMAQDKPNIPEYLLGKFTDDYGIKYAVSDSVFVQLPGTRYRIIEWNLEGSYLIAQNDKGNKTEPGLYTRIDFMTFSNMEPFKWGFCLSEYKAKTRSDAEAVKIADRQNPKKGCNGYPFSRMKRVTEE